MAKPVIREWLPREAFTADAVKAALADTIAHWVDAWFGKKVIDYLVTCADGASLPASSFRAGNKALVVDVSEEGKRNLLCALLDLDLASQSANEADDRVLDAVAMQVVEDLLVRLDTALGEQSPREGQGRIVLALSAMGRDLLKVTFPEDVAVPMLKAKLGASRRAGAPLRRRIEALGPTRLVAEGVLGRAEVAMDDLKNLAIGDVLVLDRILDQPVELRLSESGRSIGRGKLRRSEDGVSIQF